MVSMQVSERVRSVMSAVLGIDASRLGAEDSPVTVAEWDSVAHLQLMLALEEEFGVQFEADELASLRTIGMIETRLAGDAGV